MPYIRYTELEWANGVDKLNELARRFDGTDADTQKLLFGALEMRIANNIYDVLEVLSELDRYELISEAATDHELGEWVVAQGKLGVEFPPEALPLRVQLVYDPEWLPTIPYDPPEPVCGPFERCADCPYPGHGFMCWGADEERCLRTEVSIAAGIAVGGGWSDSPAHR